MSAPDEPKRGISRLLNITVNLTALSVMAATSDCPTLRPDS